MGHHNRTNASGLPCPKCGCGLTDVTDSRNHPLGRRRRRCCQGCGHVWTTHEVNADAGPAARSIAINLAKIEVLLAETKEVASQLYRAVSPAGETEES